MKVLGGEYQSVKALGLRFRNDTIMDGFEIEAKNLLDCLMLDSCGPGYPIGP
jgi:hypothetical protein